MWSDIFQTEKPGYYGQFGGMFIPEILRATFEELIAAFESYCVYKPITLAFTGPIKL